jgi:hypothetical protein
VGESRNINVGVCVQVLMCCVETAMDNGTTAVIVLHNIFAPCKSPHLPVERERGVAISESLHLIR